MNDIAGSRNLVVNGMSTWIKILLSGLFLFSASAQAAPLNLTLFNYPDIVSTFISVNYNAATDTLTASGFANELDDDGSAPAEAINGGTFDLSATIDSSGLLSGGTFSIGGTVASLGFNSNTLLTGNLIAFGFPNAGGDPLEFLFDVTGGDAAGLYAGGATPGGIILGASGFTGSFTANFSSNIGVADVTPVPVPAAIWLFGSGLLGLVGLGRRGRQA